jgi:hypothetical protein
MKGRITLENEGIIASSLGDKKAGVASKDGINQRSLASPVEKVPRAIRTYRRRA